MKNSYSEDDISSQRKNSFKTYLEFCDFKVDNIRYYKIGGKIIKIQKRKGSFTEYNKKKKRENINSEIFNPNSFKLGDSLSSEYFSMCKNRIYNFNFFR